MPESRGIDARVENALKASIEANLARERAFAEAAGDVALARFSNGIIFSKSSNGTPFSNGIFFSKTGAIVAERLADPAEREIVQELVGLDEAAFNAFTERLIRLKQAKAQGH